jgi:hypothetical protein
VDRGRHRLADPSARQDPRRNRTIQIQACDHTISVADPLPDDLRDAIDTIAPHPAE